MKYTKIYIGSNNDTKVLEIEKIKEVMLQSNSGYTLILASGFWEGIAEDTAIIEIYGDYNTGIIPELKTQLKQDSILVVEDYKQITYK